MGSTDCSTGCPTTASIKQEKSYLCSLDYSAAPYPLVCLYIPIRRDKERGFNAALRRTFPFLI